MRTSSGDSSSLGSNDWLQDSVSKRRRHAMYFYRPPIWRYSSLQDESSSPSMSEDLNGGDEQSEKDSSYTSVYLAGQQVASHAGADAAPFETLDSDSEYETPLLDARAGGGESASPDFRCSTETLLESFHQTKPVFCTRLRSYKDIRLGTGEQWAIQEGSLVIGLAPEYTVLDNHERRMDEFEVARGDVYVVCSLYADLWALCAKLSFESSPEVGDHRRLAFLPLCSVTLALNYSAFVQRSTGCSQGSGRHGDKYPGNGRPVTPLRRSHSLTASKQIFPAHRTQTSTPLAIQNIFQTFTLKHIDGDFVPLDSTLESVLSPLTSRRRRLLGRIGQGKSPSKVRNSGMQQGNYHNGLDSSLLSACRRMRSQPSIKRMCKERQNSAPSGSQALRWLLRK
ncbi:uncharacterized protein BJX67DRAFT_390182 [Aspergillus lucknowensis]|uniref:Uncharacterized protein n=1 Tax=Aspergillus lucknowensis TaxID=176173 RepID=A0ABR4LIA1_9EURO